MTSSYRSSAELLAMLSPEQIREVRARARQELLRRAKSRAATRAEREREAERLRAQTSGRTAPVWPEYRDDPVGFIETILRIRLWSKQRQLLRAIAANPKVAVRSGQKTGKTTTLVLAAIWWTCTRPRGRVRFVAPTGESIKNNCWKELRRVVDLLLDPKDEGGATICKLLGGIRPALVHTTGMQWPDGREIVGQAPEKAESLQGFSGPENLTLVDEGSGVADALFEAIDGDAAAGGHIAAAGNPTQQSGWFFDAFNSKREFWTTMVISSEEVPNVTGAEPPIAGLAEPAFIKAREREYGRDSAWFKVRILGIFAGSASNAIVALSLVDAAHKRWEARPANDVVEAPLEFGVDVARFGDDDSAIAPRRGPRVYPMITLHGFDTVGVVGKLREAYAAHARPGEVAKLKIDTTGGYGAGVADVIRADDDLSKLFDIVEVNFSSVADDETAYANLRAQIHFGVADWLKAGGEMPKDPKLEAELLTPVYGFDARGRRKVESKDEIKKRLHRSPDRADSLALAVYEGGEHPMIAALKAAAR